MVRASALVLLVLWLAPPAAAQPMNPDAPPVAGTLAPGAGTAEAAVRLRPGADASAQGCYGYLDPSAPDVVVDWAGGDLEVWAQAAFDATMAVVRPDGSVVCDDDTDGLLPAVRLANAPAGRYAVWVGSYQEAEAGLQATVYAGVPPPPPVLDAGARPAAGVVRAEGGFVAARGAIDVAVDAGGPDEMADVDLSGTPDPPAFCSGYVDADRPTAAVDYSAEGGTGALGIRASGDDDLVLVVQTPAGQVLCNDDADGLNPAVGVEDPASGVYAVWVGAFGGFGGTVRATLSVSEDLPETSGGYDDYTDYSEFAQPYSEGAYTPLDLEAPPAVRLRARAGEAGTESVTVRPEGPNPVQGASCRGYVETAATAAIELDGDGPFALTATGGDDLTLTVRTPAGDWLCSDDADGLDPGIQIDAPEAGRYLAWVGSYGELGAAVEATLAAAAGELVVSEPSFDEYGGAVLQSGGVYEGSEVRAGGAAATVDWDGASAQDLAVQAGGPVANPVRGEACGGFVSERPSAEVRAPGGLAVSASAAEDLTLTVRAPDGTWTCSDDADGTDPRVEVDGGEGVYSVWVGTYYRRGAAPATLRVAVVPPPPVMLPPPPPPPPTIRG